MINKTVSAIAGLVLLLAVATLASAQQVVKEIRVHGNYKTTDADIIRIAGIAEGDEVDDAKLDAAKQRLLQTGKFNSVEILKRYRSISSNGPLALIILVNEKESLPSKFLFMPILSYSDERGFTYGLQTTAIDLLGMGERIGIPLSWGGTKQASIKLRFDVENPLFNRIAFKFGRIIQEHPYYKIDDDRTYYQAEVKRRAGPLLVGFEGGYSKVSFDPLEERFFNYGINAAIDTRRDILLPGDAIYLGAGWERLDFRDSDRQVDRVTIDLRAFKRLIGQALLAGQVYAKTSNTGLPPYLKSWMGGAATLRGYKPGSFIGDNIFLGSLELRLPLQPLTAFYQTGIFLFWDSGKVWDEGFAFDDAEMKEGAGIGYFFSAAGFGIKLDLASNLKGKYRLHVSSGFRF